MKMGLSTKTKVINFIALIVNCHWLIDMLLENAMSVEPNVKLINVMLVPQYSKILQFRSWNHNAIFVRTLLL